MTMKSPDQLLWDRLRGGDKSALEAIYTHHVDYLYGYCLRLTKDGNLIDDAIQDFFVSIWEKRANLGATDAIRPYLITSLRRLIFKKLKKNQRTIAASEEEYMFHSEEAIDVSIIAGEWKAETSGKIKSAMQVLSNRQREAIYHKFFGDASYEEVCDIMGLNYQSARNLISTGLKRLKEEMLKNTISLIFLSTFFIRLALTL